MGASAGGVEALIKVVAPLPADLNAALFVVLHRTPTGDSLLPEILSRAGVLPAGHADEGPIESGRIYVAPPDLHVVLSPGKMHLSHGPKENGFRPAVDPLFRSAAQAYEQHAIGVILSGGLTDGAEGLRAIVECGGFAIVQDPHEAPFQGMPASALELGPVHYTLPASKIGPMIADVVAGRVEKQDLLIEQPPAPSLFVDETMGGSQTTYTCPECHGILWEVGETSKQFRCRVGHSFSMSSLVEAQDDDLERALFAALRTLEESGSLARRLAEGANNRHHHLIAHRFAERAREKEQHAAVLRDLLYTPKPRLAAVEAKRKRPERINAKSASRNGRPMRRTKAAK